MGVVLAIGLLVVSAVGLVVLAGGGSSYTTVPNVVGLSPDRAEQLFGAHRLPWSATFERRGPGPPGTVIAQNPAGGVLDKIGSRVYFTVVDPKTSPIPSGPAHF
jgi:beta-lactam-binding protein with PASTA domain